MKQSLYKFARWLCHLCAGKSHQKPYSERFNSEKSDFSDKKMESGNSSDTGSESLRHDIAKYRPMLQHFPSGTQRASASRTGTPQSEEYEKMISGIPFRVISCPQLQTKKLEARRFCAKYNVDDEVLKDDTLPLHELFMELRTERERLLRTIIGVIGQSPVIEPPFHFQYGCNITIGDSFYANVNMRIMDSGFVSIGNRVLVGPNVTIVTELHDKLIASRRDGNVFSRPVTIEDDCWIGVGTTILPGVTIGRGSVIGAGSVVTRDIPPSSVAWGNPARVVEPVKDAVN